MPTNKDLKRRVRARMEKTGESYTAARARVVQRKRKPGPQSATSAAAGADWPKLAGMSDAAVSKKTGKSWREWVAVLDRGGAKALSHPAIVSVLRQQHALDSWWSQTVTVGYERIRGLRETGQKRDGSYEVGKSKTVAVPVAELWTGFCRCDRWLGGTQLRMSKAVKHKSMRMRFTDDTPIEVLFLAKGPRKSQVQIQHRKLASREAAQELRAFWSERLAELARQLVG